MDINIGKVDIEKDDPKFYAGFMCGVMTTTDALRGIIPDNEDIDTLYKRFWEYMDNLNE